jgi:hypothetical protein
VTDAATEVSKLSVAEKDALILFEQLTTAHQREQDKIIAVQAERIAALEA